MSQSNKMTVIVNVLLMGKTLTVETEHENVAWYGLGDENGVLTIQHEDNSRTVYAPGIWREFDYSPKAVS